jgi:hypothetical protein
MVHLDTDCHNDIKRQGRVIGIDNLHSQCIGFSIFFFFKLQAGHWWLTPVILVIWEAEIGRITVPDQPQQLLQENPTQNNQGKMDWSCDSSSRVPAL